MESLFGDEDQNLSFEEQIDQGIRLYGDKKYEKALTYFGELENLPLTRDQRSRCILYESFSYEELRQYDKALEKAGKVLALSKKSPYDPQLESDALHQLGDIYRRKWKLSTSEAFHRGACSIREDGNDTTRLIVSYFRLADVARFRGDLERAEEFVHLANDHAVTLDDSQKAEYSFWTQQFLALIYSEKGHLDKSMKINSSLLEEAEKSRDPFKLKSATFNLGVIKTFMGELNEAEQLMTQCLDASKETLDFDLATHAAAFLAFLAFKQGNRLLAQEMVNTFFDLVNNASEEYNLMSARYLILRVVLETNTIDIARDLVQEFQSCTECLEWVGFRMMHQLALGWLKLYQHDPGSALQHGSNALDLLDSFPSKPTFTLIETILFLTQAFLHLFILTGELKYKKELKSKLDRLMKESKHLQLHEYHAESLILQGLLKRAEFDLPSAEHLFKTAQVLAEERAMHQIKELASKELETLQDQATSLQHFQMVSPEAYEQAQLRGLQVYLMSAKKTVYSSQG